MPLTTITAAKESAVTFQPLLLVALTLADASVLRWATHDVTPVVPGFAYSGQFFEGRLAQQDLEAIQSMSDQGVDQLGSASLHIADPDRTIYTNHYLPKGFKGATVELFFLYWDVGTATFSSDFQTKMVGVCDAPSVEPDRITVTAKNKLNLQKTQLPVLRIQRRCSWINPITAAARADANNEDSPYFECGETRDLVTAPPCSYTAETCTQPLRFSGITFAPPDRWSSRGYLEGKTIEGTNSPNDAKYGEPVPLCYGTTWVEPPIMNVIGDANSTRMEAILCMGDLQGVGTTNPGRVIKVLVNDVEVPFVAYSPDKKIFRWEWVATGARDGARNQDAGYDGKGDPYGSMATIEICVYRKLATSESLPRVRVLLQGPKIRVYSDAVTFTKEFTSNPVWVLLDILTWSGLRYAEVNMPLFIAAAAKCPTAISYKDSNNTTLTHERFDCSLALRDRRSAAEVVRGILRTFNGNLIWNAGKLDLAIRATLAEQQPSVIAGSNHNTPIASKSYAGGTVNGYAAYNFNESSILENNGRETFRILARPISDLPNRVACAIQDKHNGHVIDSFTLVDSEDVKVSQQEISTQIEALGLNSYDQANRISETFLAEQLRGNPRGDSGGTMIVEFDTTAKAVHLRVSQLVRLSYARHGLTNQLFRILRLSPSTNFETVRITASWHSDDWYLDSYGQARDPRPGQGGLDPRSRPPWPWMPNTEAPIASDALFDPTEKSFAARQDYSEISPSGARLAVVHLRGVAPITTFAVDTRPPVVALQANVSPTGGALPGGGKQYWIGVVPIIDGKRGAMSILSSAVITGAGSTYSLSVPVYAWPDDTTEYEILAGENPARICWQASGSGKPTSVTLAGPLKKASYAPPDSEARRIDAYAKIIAHAGVFGALVGAVGAGTVTAGGGWTTNQWAGYDLSLLAKADGSEQPIASFRVVSNTATVLTVTPDPTGILEVGDVVVMRSKPTVSGSTLTDPNWLNAASNGGLGLVPDQEAGRVLRIIAGKGRGYAYPIASNTDDSITIAGDWVESPDGTSRYIVEEPSWLPGTSYDITANLGTEVALRFEVTSYRKQTILIAGWIAGDNGKESLEVLSPLREMYIFGEPPSVRTVTVDTVATIYDELILVDTTANAVTVALPLASERAGRDLAIKHSAGGVHGCFVNTQGSDTFDDGTTSKAVALGDTLIITGKS